MKKIITLSLGFHVVFQILFKVQYIVINVSLGDTNEILLSMIFFIDEISSTEGSRDALPGNVIRSC